MHNRDTVHSTGPSLVRVNVMSGPRPRFEAMYRAFKFTTEAGAYWSVVDASTYETVTVADRFLQYITHPRTWKAGLAMTREQFIDYCVDMLLSRVSSY